MAFYQLYNIPKKQFTKYLLKALDGKESVSISSISFLRLFHSYMFGINSIPTPLLPHIYVPFIYRTHWA